MRKLSIALLLCASLPSLQGCGQTGRDPEQELLSQHAGAASHGPHRVVTSNCGTFLHQPDGPFSVLRLCMDGDAPGISVHQFNPAPFWPDENRSWQEASWSLDASSVAWVPGENVLLVTTNGIYGTGGLDRLSLEPRETLRLYPPGAPPEEETLAQVALIRHDPASGQVDLDVEDPDTGAIRRVVVVDR